MNANIVKTKRHDDTRTSKQQKEFAPIFKTTPIY